MPSSSILPAYADRHDARAYVTRLAGFVEPPVEGNPNRYNYHPKSTLALGRGFDPADITADKLPAIKFTPVELDPGIPSLAFETYYVRSEIQVDFALTLEAKADAAYLGLKGGGRTYLSTDFQYRESDIVVVCRVSADCGRWGLSTDRALTPDALALLGDGKEFAKRFGTGFFSTEWRGATASIILTLQDVETSLKLDFQNDFQASAGWGKIASASASNKFTALLKRAAKQSRLSIAAYSSGLGDLSGVAAAVGALAGQNKDPISAIQQLLSGVLGKLDKHAASAVGYGVSSMDQFGWSATGVDPWSDILEAKLRRLASEYRRVTSELEFVAAIRAGTSPLATLLPPSVPQRLIASESRLTKYQLDLANVHRELKEKRDISLGDLPVSFIPPIDDWILDYIRPPRFKLEVVGLTSDQTRTVINAPRGMRLQIAQGFNPTLRAFGATYSMEAVYGLYSLQFFLRFEDGAEELGVEAAYSGGAGIWVIEGQGGNLEDQIMEMASKYKGTRAAQAGWRVRDKAQRVFAIGIIDLSWFVNSAGALTRYEYQVLA